MGCWCRLDAGEGQLPGECLCLGTLPTSSESCILKAILQGTVRWSTISGLAPIRLQTPASNPVLGLSLYYLLAKVLSTHCQQMPQREQGHSPRSPESRVYLGSCRDCYQSLWTLPQAGCQRDCSSSVRAGCRHQGLDMVVRGGVSQPDSLDLSPTSAVFSLCGHGHITEPLDSSISSSVK